MTENLSAWMDGELESEHARQLLSQLKHDASLRGAWDCYHLIGDTLRGVQCLDPCARICARLDAEPMVLAPQRRSASEMLRRRPLQIAASIAALAFVGGIWMVLPGLRPDSAQIATVPSTEVKEGTVLAGEDANGYLLAHQGYSPSNAMQGIASYVRTVAEEWNAELCSPLSPGSTPRTRRGAGSPDRLRPCSE